MAGGLSVGVVGEIRMWAGQLVSLTGTVEPVTGWLLCNGALVSTSTYDDLFTLAGHTYNGGVDPGSSQFKLPDLRGRTPVGSNATGIVTRGASSGAETVALTYAMVPTHSHFYTMFSSGSHSHSGTSDTEGSAHTHTLNVNVGNIRVGAGGNTAYQYWTVSGASPIASFLSTETHAHSHVFTTTAASPTSHSHTFSSTEVGTAGSPTHNNVSPYTLVHWLVKV
jgi:microcystin-dependent protein